MSEEIKGIKFYRLQSEVEGDETLKGSLGASDVDGNFYYLREMLISSAYTAEYNVETDNGEVETTAELVLTRVNGKELHIDLTPFLPNFEEYDIQTAYDATLGELSLCLYKDGELVTVNTINGLVTDENFKREFDNAIDFEVIKRVLSDATIKGIGTKDQLLGVNPLYINGQMEPCVSYVDITVEGENLPADAKTGEYYLVKDFSDEYGKLYPYSAVKKIQSDLDAEALEQYNQFSGDTSKIGWRVPCEQDWDDMLNAVELEYAKSIGCIEYDLSGNIHSTLDTYPTYTHSSTDFIGYALGYVAGRLLRSKSYWSGSTENKGWQCGEDYVGTDSYGFKAEPVGYAMIDEILLMHGEEGSMWIAGTGANFEPKSKLHQYDYIKFYGKGNAKAKTFIASGKTDGGPANLVKTDMTSTDSFRSIRLVKEYDGGNYSIRENILGRGFNTILLPSLTADSGYKVWTVENFDVDFQNEDNTFKYGSKPTLNDKLSDADKFKHYYLAYKTPNNWDYRELVNGESVVLAEPIFSGDNAYDEYRLINGELVNVTTDEFAIYNRIADVELNLEQLKRDHVKTAIWAWGAIDDVTKVASGNSMAISALSENLLGLAEDFEKFSTSTDDSINNIISVLTDLFGSVSGMATLDALKHLIGNVETLSGDFASLSAKHEADMHILTDRLDEVDEQVAELSGVLGTVSAQVEDLVEFVGQYSGDIMSIATLSGDLYSLSGKVDSNYEELVTLINSEISQLRQSIIDLMNNRFALAVKRFQKVEADVKEIKDELCNMQKTIALIMEVINNKVPLLHQQVIDLENINADERLTDLEEKVRKCCGVEEGEDDPLITIEYIKKLIAEAVYGGRLRSIIINGKLVATEGHGINNTECGTFVNIQQNTDNTYFTPVVGGESSIFYPSANATVQEELDVDVPMANPKDTFIPVTTGVTLDDVTPFTFGGIPCGTSLRELSGMNLSILLQNILFPTVYPSVYQEAGITLTNIEPLLSADIAGEMEKDGCYVQKDYVVVEVGTHFHKRMLPMKSKYSEDKDAGYVQNAKAYIECDCSKASEDQNLTIGTSGVTYLVRQTPYNDTTEGSNIIYPNEVPNDGNWSNMENKIQFTSVGEIEIMAEARFTPIEGELIDSNRKPTDKVYVMKDGKKVLTTLEELKEEGEGERYNFYSKHSNILKAYVSEPIFLINGTVLNGCLTGLYSDSTNPLQYAGWRKGYAQSEEGIIYPKNGVGSVISMQKWGPMNAEFNIVTDFVSLQFGVLSPIELSNISMKALDTNDPTNNQVSNFVSKDALLDETFNYYANNQDEWLARNIPNGFVRYDEPIYVAFQCWEDCTKYSIGAYYLYVWVGGAQVPTRFKVRTNDPFVDTEESVDNN